MTGPRVNSVRTEKIITDWKGVEHRQPFPVGRLLRVEIKAVVVSPAGGETTHYPYEPERLYVMLPENHSMDTKEVNLHNAEPVFVSSRPELHDLVLQILEQVGVYPSKE